MPIIKKIIIICIVWFSGESPLFAANNKIAVFYPQSKEPYQSIYQEIITGIESSQQDILVVELSKDYVAASITKELVQKEINKVIVLGRLGIKLARQLPENIHVISGALPIPPGSIDGISLIADPIKLFEYLNTVAPAVKNVHVAFSSENQWMIDLAEAAAKKKNLVLKAKLINQTAEAIQYYNQLFGSLDSSQDSIWLPLDRVTSHDKVILPLILEKAWSKEIVVFSSKPSHAKRGALFSTYPDNYLLGQQLSKMVNSVAAAPDTPKFAVLDSLQLAVNIRTAAHLGLKYSSDQQKQFKLTFPE
ncbi:ABC transporter substrate binding protein [Aliikangiella maris]|uniref:ABC transporter substrate binding protein n=2 Tax=Aliikangiella maris TaxID=3162458 RepID=A0ABV2BNW4_9GAMM